MEVRGSGRGGRSQDAEFLMRKTSNRERKKPRDRKESLYLPRA